MSSGDGTASIIGEGRHDRLSEKLIRFAQMVIVGIFGILPILFIPSVEAPLGYTKVFLVVAGLLIALVLLGFSIVRTGSVNFFFPLPIILLWLLSLAALASAALSGDFSGSFFGDTLESQTALFLIILAATATIATQLLGSRPAAMRFYIVLLGSTLLLAVFHLVRLFFGYERATFGAFGGNPTLSPIGSWNDIAIFFGLAILLALVALEQLTLSRVGKILFASVAVAALIMLAVINFFSVWLVLGLVSLAVLVYGISKDRLSPGGESSSQKKISSISLGISGLVFAVSALFVIGGSFLGGAVANMTGISYIEVRPSWQATAEIARNVYGDSVLFGVGPNNFVDAWRQHRDSSINETIFWNTDFAAGIGYIPTAFVTTGVVGGLLWLIFLGLFLTTGIRMLVRAPADADRVWHFIGTSAFVAAAYGWGMALIYVPGSTILLLTAFCTGLMFAAYGHLVKARHISFTFRGSRSLGFVLVTAVMLIMVGSVATLYWVGRHYTAAYAFSRSVSALVAGDIDRGEALTAQAYALSTDDRYARRIAEIRYARAVEMLNTTGEPTAEQQTRFEETLVSAVRAAQAAVALNPTEANNWGLLGNVYALLLSLEVEGSYEEALAALTEARSRDPQNPVRVLSLGQLELLRGNTEAGRALISESVRMKSDYTEGILALSQLDIAAGDIASAIAATERVISIEPQNPVRYFQLGILELSRQNRDGGIRALEAAVALQPDYSNARYYLALAYDAAGRPSDARAQLEEVARLNLGNAVVAELLATLAAGGSIGDLLEGGIGNTPVSDARGDTADEAPVGRDNVPDSPLLSPVNTPPDAEDTENDG